MPSLIPDVVALPPGEGADRWRSSGAMALTGRPAQPPLMAPDGVVDLLVSLEGAIGDRTARLGRRVAIDACALLGERAAFAGFVRGGARSCGGSTRLLPCADGWIALSLARPDDAGMLPALLPDYPSPVEALTDDADPWPDVSRSVRGLDAATLVERGSLLGMAVARLGERAAAPPVRVLSHHPGPPAATMIGALVVDLSSLWAGPLCGHLLQAAGARIVKVESSRRPDGARGGAAGFFHLLHAGQQMVALDFADRTDRAVLAGLLRAADVVIEGSRPRALEQLGVSAEALVATATGPKVWLSITGHGRDGSARNRVGFGDDAAVAGGLVASDAAGPCFCADAVADPLTGLSAAVAVLGAWETGGAWLLDVALAAVAAAAAAAAAGNVVADPDGPSLQSREAVVLTSGAAEPPRARRPSGTAAALGADTARVLSSLGLA